MSSSLLELKCTSFIPGGGYVDILELLRLRVEEATVKKRFGFMLFQNNICKFRKESTPDFMFEVAMIVEYVASMNRITFFSFPHLRE